jgi:hypothetical protein
MTPIDQGRQLDEMICMWKQSPGAEYTRLPFSSTPAVLPN